MQGLEEGEVGSNSGCQIELRSAFSPSAGIQAASRILSLIVNKITNHTSSSSDDTENSTSSGKTETSLRHFPTIHTNNSIMIVATIMKRINLFLVFIPPQNSHPYNIIRKLQTEIDCHRIGRCLNCN